ncbi:MAG: hypothetical protein L0228_03000 [Planctomycetes bacterium]|nr:hypothetical protein [Planctomycetota bacterium]
MQVDRQPSPWPCVVMLVGLLIFCLTVPKYWRKPTKAVESPVAVETTRVQAHQRSPKSALSLVPYAVSGGPSFDFAYAARQHSTTPSKFVLDNDLLSFWASPTIEELIAARFGVAQQTTDSFDWPTFIPAATAENSQPADSVPGIEATVELDPSVAAAFDRIGRAVVTYAPAELVPRLTAQAARAYQLWSTKHMTDSDETAAVASALRFLGPNDVLATVLQNKEKPTVIEPDADGFNFEEFESDPWCVPQVLFDQLQRIACHPYAAEWAEETIAQLQALTERSALGGDDVQAILASLCDLAQEAVRMADETDDDRLRVELLRAHWALARRLDRWSVVHDIRMAARAGDRLAARGSLGTYFDGLPNRPVTQTDDLTLALESYEESRDPQLGRQIVAEKRALESSSDSLDRSLADAVEQHYRNANVRVAITAEMLNRYVGQERSEVRPVRDRIAGAAIRGQSHLQSTSRVRLDPAIGRWELGVESQGTVESNALADGGQARIRSQMATDFSARKRVVVDSTGVLLQPASIDVDTHNRLMGVTTDVDWVPLVRSYARDRAMQEYRARQARAKREVESKVAAEAVNSIDQETKDTVERIEKQIRERVTDRLARYSIKVTPIELTTTHERVVARLRVASDEQPGSHTPRPRALSDSLASAQIHETALTNAAVGLELDGARYSAIELAELIQKKIPQVEAPRIGDKERDTMFQFAKQDAIRFHIEDGRLEVTLAMVSVEHDGRRMRNFVVHAFYVPVVNGLEAELERDGSLGIEGRLSSTERARLHNVFNAVMPPERTVPIVRLDDPQDSRLAGLMITQLVLEDGWVGLAVGPATSERVAERSRSLR